MMMRKIMMMMIMMMTMMTMTITRMVKMMMTCLSISNDEDFLQTAQVRSLGVETSLRETDLEDIV